MDVDILDYIEIDGQRKPDETDHAVPVKAVLTISLPEEFFGRMMLAVQHNDTDIIQ